MVGAKDGEKSWLRFSTTQLSTDNFLAHHHTPTTYTDMTYLLRIYSNVGLGSSLRGEPGLTTFKSQGCP